MSRPAALIEASMKSYWDQIEHDGLEPFPIEDSPVSSDKSKKTCSDYQIAYEGSPQKCTTLEEVNFFFILMLVYAMFHCTFFFG